MRMILLVTPVSEKAWKVFRKAYMSHGASQHYSWGQPYEGQRESMRRQLREDGLTEGMDYVAHLGEE
jgi:hypothetical protein